MSDHDDQFLNDVLQFRKQLTLPGMHIHLIVQHFVATFTGHSIQELVSYAPIKVLSTSPMQANEGSNQGIRINFSPRAREFNL